ncbi:hypothetical protein [Mycobacterium asiaticum]|uniref:Uncharacterized protein n=1 Tax=Mycobacterium asiaticum TaxID=1790 RepID=A0A1A3NK57_MYCAS|nr:hypothetical protein [Mycobacterium asiaticum]OBK22523.1 hypothetical protein A5635_21645 [Mycobacterium asiaticum]
MSTLTATIEHNGITYNAEPVLITKTFLGREDHGFFTATLSVDLGSGAGTSLGGYALDDKPGPDGRRQPTAGGLEWLIRTIEVVGVDSWEALRGRRCYALFEADTDRYSRAGFNCQGIASLDGKRVFLFAEVWA